ncbi:MAG TPA: alpha/beta hydrolase [Rhodocyclaceae bacterium]|nr:alpha/beta hydrolase [Rhodocyclaceae bacterium]
MPALRRLATAALVAGTLALGGCIEWLYFYNPSQLSYATPEERGLRYEEVNFSSSDGTRLYGWFIPARGKRHGTIAYFHGNTKNISGHLRYVEWLPDRGYDVFLFDYRGYGRSAGSPDPRGVHDDCVAALAYLRSRADVDQERLAVFGQSLGGNYALSALADVRRQGIRAAVIEGAFASHREIAMDKIAGYPLPEGARSWLVDTLIDDRFDALGALKRIDGIPLLLIHGTQDNVVPYRHAQLLYAAAHGRRQLWTVEGGRHLDTFVYRQDPWRRKLVEYLDAALPLNSPPTPSPG